jgi:hypothetical protein
VGRATRGALLVLSGGGGDFIEIFIFKIYGRKIKDIFW